MGTEDKEEKSQFDTFIAVFFKSFCKCIFLCGYESIISTEIMSRCRGPGGEDMDQLHIHLFSFIWKVWPKTLEKLPNVTNIFFQTPSSFGPQPEQPYKHLQIYSSCHILVSLKRITDNMLTLNCPVCFSYKAVKHLHTPRIINVISRKTIRVK